MFEGQLQVGADGFGILLLIILLLCELITLAKLGMELNLIFPNVSEKIATICED